MMKKIAVMASAVLISAWILAACTATELEDRCFPMMAAVDYRDGQVDFAYGFPQLSQKDDTDLDAGTVNISMAAGGNFAESVRRYNQEMNRLADCNHMKVLVFGTSLAGEREQYEKMLKYLQKSELFPRNTYVCVTDDIDALFEAEQSLPDDLGSYLESFLQKQEKEQDVKLLHLGKLLDEQYNQMENLQAPYLAVENGTIILKPRYSLP